MWHVGTNPAGVERAPGAACRVPRSSCRRGVAASTVRLCHRRPKQTIKRSHIREYGPVQSFVQEPLTGFGGCTVGGDYHGQAAEWRDSRSDRTIRWQRRCRWNGNSGRPVQVLNLTIVPLGDGHGVPVREGQPDDNVSVHQRGDCCRAQLLMCRSTRLLLWER